MLRVYQSELYMRRYNTIIYNSASLSTVDIELHCSVVVVLSVGLLEFLQSNQLYH